MKRKQMWKAVAWIAVTALLLLYPLKIKENAGVTTVLVVSYLCIYSFFQFLLALCFIDKSEPELPKLGLRNFLIGDEGGYSLSRLQAVIWAVAIIGYQVTVILLLVRKQHLDYFQLTFSEQAMWLLGLSLTTAISVKAISVNNIQSSPGLLKKTIKPRVSDIFVGENGLDFSRCQMFVWTILGVVVFLNICYRHLDALNKVGGKAGSRELAAAYHSLFNNHLDEISAPVKAADPAKVAAPVNPAAPVNAAGPDNAASQIPPIPYLPWSFIILMGLSQGAYVGKKLIPTHKLDAVRDNKQLQLRESLNELNVKKDLLKAILANTSRADLTNIELANKKVIEDQITLLEREGTMLMQDINEIDQFKTSTAVNI